MDDMRTVAKELRLIADAGERIAKVLEKQNQILSIVPKMIAAAGEEADLDKDEA